MSNEIKKSAWNFFIKNRRFTIILVITMSIMGLVTVFQIPKESNPEVDFPIAFISTPYIGASAEDVEELVTNVIEDKIANVAEVDKITSTSSKGFSMIVVQFEMDSDGAERLAELKDKVDKAKRELPADAEDPIVEQISFDNEPIMRFSLSGPFSVPQLKNYADELKSDIERVGGVNKVEIIGGQDREVQVVVNKTILDSFGLLLSQVTGAIRGANTDIPIGSIETAGENYSITFAGRINDVETVKNIPITVMGESPVFVKDVAEVVDGFSEAKNVSRLSVGGQPSEPAIAINIMKAAGGNILKTADGIDEAVEESINNYLPENVHVEKIDDMARLVRSDLGDLSVSGLETVAIVMLLLLIFVGWREALLAGLAIPLSFLITFIFLGYLGYTLNFITLFSLILALGILVDGTIVIIEGINRHLKDGRDARDAAMLTVHEFKAPLISGTLTTVFAFLPMILTSGIIGKFIRSIPVTISIVLMSSLFVALGVVSSLAAGFLKKKKFKIDGSTGEVKRNLMERLAERYERSIRVLFKHKSLRRKLTWVLVVGFVLSISLPITGVLSTNMFPPQDFTYFLINIEEPSGTPLEQTSQTAAKVESMLLDNSAIKSLQINIGYAQDVSGAGLSSTGDNIASFVVNMKPEEERELKSFEVAAELEEKFKDEDWGRAKVRVVELTSGPPSGAAVDMTLSGTDLEELDSLALEMAEILKGISGTRNVRTSIQETNGEFVINIDRTKAQLYGVTTSQVAMVLRNAISGSTATVIREGGNDVDVVVKYDMGEDDREITLNDIESLTIATMQGDIPLSSFVSSGLDNSRLSIGHKNGKRNVRVLADIEKGTTVPVVVNQFKEKMKEFDMPADYTVEFGGEQQDIEKSFTDMMKAFILGIFAIAMLLILQFNSYRQPLFILMTIPLSFIGVFTGLALMDQSFSFPAAIGVVALAGIVVNNAIILIDKINKNRRNGMDKEEAIVDAGKSRLQPILLTTITTVSGVLPLALSNPMWGPIAYSIIFGLLFSTILTLIVVPMLYRRFGEKELD